MSNYIIRENPAEIGMDYLVTVKFIGMVNAVSNQWREYVIEG